MPWTKTKEKERLRGKKKINEALAPKLNNQEVQRQILPWPQVWPRRQETSQQWTTTGLAQMEGVERTNVVMARSQ